jgi:hypothetical protein
MICIKSKFYIPKSNVIGHPSSHHQEQTKILSCPLHCWLTYTTFLLQCFPPPGRLTKHTQTHSSVLKLNQQSLIGPTLQKHYLKKHSTLMQDIMSSQDINIWVAGLIASQVYIHYIIITNCRKLKCTLMWPPMALHSHLLQTSQLMQKLK